MLRVVGVSMFLWAQAPALAPSNSSIEFEALEHDFGEVTEGPAAQHTFKFTNKSSQPLRLKSVKPSCGCTTPRWTQEEIPPGGRGEIHVSYDTKGRPGPFHKTITVQHSQSETPIILSIKGKVIRDPALANFNEVFGSLGLEKSREALGTLKSNEKKTLSSQVKNLSSMPLSLRKVDAKPAFTATFEPAILQPGAVGKLEIKIDGSKWEASGFRHMQGFYEKIALQLSDETEVPIYVSGSFERYYTPQELANAPKIVFERTEFDGGEVLQGQIVEFAFRLRNEGKSDLVIESVKASCGCTAIEPTEKVIRPGAESVITARFDSRGREGLQHKTVTVQTNDPANPSIILHLKANVVPSSFGLQGPTNP
ncbi:MAG: DUF1573 domain-containing protein [Bacteroidia bacterium]